jgi:hypothetical protein
VGLGKESGFGRWKMAMCSNFRGNGESDGQGDLGEVYEFGLVASLGSFLPRIGSKR